MSNPSIVGVTRPAFLILTPVCVFVGLAVAAAGNPPVDWVAAAIATLGALAAHISVNALNEYGDFHSGLDLRTERTPFSGGSGTLIARPALAEYARLIGLATLALTAICGLALVLRVGSGLVPLGLIGLTLVYYYTSKVNHHRWLCLIAPGLGFGPVMVAGTAYAVTGSWTWSASIASLVPFFVVNNLLLLNQFPDVSADQSVGRDNLPIALGPKRSLQVYALFALLAYVSVGVGVGLGLLPPFSLIALLTLPVAAQVYRGVSRIVERSGPLVPEIVPAMRLNVALSLLTPALFSVGTLVTF